MAGTRYGSGRRLIELDKLARDEYEAMRNGQQYVPVAVGQVGERKFWWFQNRFYWDNDGLAQQEVYALLVTRQQRERQRIQMAQATVATGAVPRPSSRAAIPDDVKQFVFARDGGRCRQCGATSDLQFDHVISITLGGGSSADNLQLLCGACNRRKGAGLTSGYPSPVTQQSAAATWIPPSSPPSNEPWWKQPGLRS